MPYGYTVTTYEKVTSHAIRYGKCPICGKRTQRLKTFTQTVNPFNKNPDGTVKTRAEVSESVKSQAKAWNPPPERFTHVDYDCGEFDD